MTILEFCRTQTQAHELCVFRDRGYIVSAVWIDYEDIFQICDHIKNAELKAHTWGTLSIVTQHGDKLEIPCHYIDF